MVFVGNSWVLMAGKVCGGQVLGLKIKAYLGMQ